MFRRRTNRIPEVSKSIAIESGSVDVLKSEHGKLSHKTRRKSGKSFHSSPSTRSVLKAHFAACVVLFVRSYFDGITAAGNETWYPVPLIGYVRSELALVCFVFGSIPFLLAVLGWTYAGVLLLSGLAVGIPQLLMPGPIPTPDQAYYCYGVITFFVAVVVAPLWKKPQAAIAMFLAISIAMPNLPEVFKPLFSSTEVEYIPEMVINYRPDIVEDVGAAALETGPLLNFVWENRNEWVKVSHGRALGYFVFG
jgi:hypothetical protein